MRIVVPKNGRPCKVQDYREPDAEPVEEPAHLEEACRKAQDSLGGAYENQEDKRGGKVQQHLCSPGFEKFGSGVESQAEIEENRGREDRSGEVTPVHHLIKSVQFS